MIEENVSSDVAKEVLTVLSYCEDEFISNIPDTLLKNLSTLAADSTKEFFINKEKPLMEQFISEDCKDILGLLYFMYMTDTTSPEVLNIWAKNENSIS